MNPLPYASLEQMQLWAAGVMARPRDYAIGGDIDPYMLRWWVIPRNEGCNLYLHDIRRSDDDRAGHDHPWENTSFVLEGGYIEVLFDPAEPWREVDRVWRGPGSIVTRKATDTHRLIVPEGGRAVSLFMTGPKVRDWGFWCPGGVWVPWQQFTGGEDGELVGQGCDG